MGWFSKSKEEKEAEEKFWDAVRKQNTEKAINNLYERIKELSKIDLVCMRRNTMFEIMKIESQQEAVLFMEELSFSETNVVSHWSIEGPKRVIEHYNKKSLTGLYLLLKAIDKAIKDKDNG